MNAHPVVMILAAGRGARMGALTETCPKPLLQVGEHALIEHHLYRLGKLGFSDVVINTAYLGEMIPAKLGNGAQYGVSITYSHEEALGLETAGGIVNALPLLGNAPFIVINADVWTDYDVSQLSLNDDQLATLVLVDNPVHHPEGDFALMDGQVSPEGSPRYTFSGIGLYSPALFCDLAPGFRPLKAPLLDVMDKGQIGGVHYTGEWEDIGTPERLEQINARYQAVSER